MNNSRYKYGKLLTNANGILSFDDANRLSALDQNSAAVHQRYTYNGRGERTVKSGWDAASASIQPQGYFGYNERGQLINEYRVPPTVDCGGTASSSALRQIGEGEGAQREENANRWTRQKSCPVSTTSGPSYVPTVDYVYLDDAPIAVITWSLSSANPSNPTYAAKVFYLQTDHLNTPRAVIDPTRNVAIWTWDFFGSAFGENAPNQDPDHDGVNFALNLRYPGQYFDTESGLHYNYFRDYEPATGRYIESDPIGLGGGISTYGYVGSNPGRLTDPKGLDFWVEGSVQGEGGYPLHQSVCVGKRGTSNRFCISFGVAEDNCLMNCLGKIYIDTSAEGPLVDLRQSSEEIDNRIRVDMTSRVGGIDRYFLIGNNCRNFSGNYFWGLDLTYGKGFMGSGLKGQPFWGIQK